MQPLKILLRPVPVQINPDLPFRVVLHTRIELRVHPVQGPADDRLEHVVGRILRYVLRGLEKFADVRSCSFAVWESGRCIPHQGEDRDEVGTVRAQHRVSSRLCVSHRRVVDALQGAHHALVAVTSANELEKIKMRLRLKGKLKVIGNASGRKL